MTDQNTQQELWHNKSLTYLQMLWVTISIIVLVMGAVIHVSTKMNQFDLEIQGIKSTQARLEHKMNEDSKETDQKLDQILDEIKNISIELVNKEPRK